MGGTTSLVSHRIDNLGFNYNLQRRLITASIDGDVISFVIENSRNRRKWTSNWNSDIKGKKNRLITRKDIVLTLFFQVERSRSKKFCRPCGVPVDWHPKASARPPLSPLQHLWRDPPPCNLVAAMTTAWFHNGRWSYARSIILKWRLTMFQSHFARPSDRYLPDILSFKLFPRHL